MGQGQSASASTDQDQASYFNGGSELRRNFVDDDSPIRHVPISQLLPADSPRRGGEDIEHTRTLASVDAPLPPIIVHRDTMRVIDGMHRLGAALLCGNDKIRVRFFDGTEQEAFVLAVQTNIAHGLPLSRADRTVAAKRIIASHPTWSDRAIAAAAGLGARTVGSLRRRAEGEAGTANEERARLGRDGRVRPLNHAEGRLRASKIIRDRPEASLREVAKSAGVSPSTVRDVRKRIQRGEDPVPSAQIPAQRRNDVSTNGVKNGQLSKNRGLASTLQGLKDDPSLRLTEAGRFLLRWIFSRVIRPGEWRDVATTVPPHCTYILADVARHCASEWTQIADDLEKRSTHV